MPEQMVSTSLLLQTLADISDVRQSIGNLQGQNNLILKNLQDATDSRGKLHQRMDYLQSGYSSLSTRLEVLEGDMAILERDLTRILPTVLAHADGLQQKIGEQKLVTRWVGYATSTKAFIAAAIAAASGTGAWWIWWRHGP